MKINRLILCFSVICIVFLILGLASCRANFKKIPDKLVLKDGSEFTGVIEKYDSTGVKIRQMDESARFVALHTIDTVVPCSYFTRMSSVSMGLFTTPYFSVFENKSHAPTNLGLALRTGRAFNGNRYQYVQYTIIPSQPFAIKKLGVGMEFYKRGKYYDRKNIFWGLESNLMFIRNNNAPQITFEPSFGKQWKFRDQVRFYGRVGLQFNLASRNSNPGIQFTAGCNFLHKNFKKDYTDLNSIIQKNNP